MNENKIEKEGKVSETKIILKRKTGKKDPIYVQLYSMKKKI